MKTMSVLRRVRRPGRQSDGGAEVKCTKETVSRRGVANDTPFHSLALCCSAPARRTEFERKKCIFSHCSRCVPPFLHQLIQSDRRKPFARLNLSIDFRPPRAARHSISERARERISANVRISMGLSLAGDREISSKFIFAIVARAHVGPALRFISIKFNLNVFPSWIG